jgi:hypothetical protein
MNRILSENLDFYAEKLADFIVHSGAAGWKAANQLMMLGSFEEDLPSLDLDKLGKIAIALGAPVLRVKDAIEILSDYQKNPLTEMSHEVENIASGFGNLDSDEQAYADHLNDLKTGVSDENMNEIESLLMKICAKFKKANQTMTVEQIAQAVEILEKVDLLLGEDLMEEGSELDRKNLVSQVQLFANKIATKVPFARIPETSLSVMASNLQAIANKLN